MDRSDFERYIEEMKALSRRAAVNEEVIPAVAENEISSPQPESEDMSGTGFLLVNVTSVRELYPVKNARVTVFRGNVDSMEKIAESVTDESGKSELFSLVAPPTALAQDSENQKPTFASYNILTEADGFLPTINYNAAVFDKVTSIQNVNLIPKTAYNEYDSNIYDEETDYDL